MAARFSEKTRLPVRTGFRAEMCGIGRRLGAAAVSDHF